MIWKSKVDRERAAKWLACLPQSVWFRLLEDIDSPVWRIDERDDTFFHDVQRIRSGRDGPTHAAIVDRLKRAISNPSFLEDENGSKKHQTVCD